MASPFKQRQASLKSYYKHHEKYLLKARKYRANNPEKIKVSQRKSQQKTKRIVFEHYSKNSDYAVCACCKEKEFTFLVIDHINGGGTQQRKTIPGGISFYTWLKKNNFPDGFQILCHNCNMSKHLNKGTCVHQIES